MYSTTVNTVEPWGFREMRGISWLAANQSASQEGLCTVQWVSEWVRDPKVAKASGNEKCCKGLKMTNV